MNSRIVHCTACGRPLSLSLSLHSLPVTCNEPQRGKLALCTTTSDTIPLDDGRRTLCTPHVPHVMPLPHQCGSLTSVIVLSLVCLTASGVSGEVLGGMLWHILSPGINCRRRHYNCVNVHGMYCSRRQYKCVNVHGLYSSRRQYNCVNVHGIKLL